MITDTDRIANFCKDAVLKELRSFEGASILRLSLICRGLEKFSSGEITTALNKLKDEEKVYSKITKVADTDHIGWHLKLTRWERFKMYVSR